MIQIRTLFESCYTFRGVALQEVTEKSRGSSPFSLLKVLDHLLQGLLFFLVLESWDPEVDTATATVDQRVLQKCFPN